MPPGSRPSGLVTAADFDRVSSKADFSRGLLATLPLLVGVVAFGLLYGLMARQVGFSPGEALAMSLIVHAGSAQFVALGMWDTAGALTIVLTTLIINLRHLLMGASIAPHLRGLSPSWKALLALWMSDESYALSITEYRQGWGSRWYFLGANVGIYVTWALSGLLGALLGTAIPDPSRYGLDLVFPLAFLGLLAAFIKERIDLAVALAAGGLALVAAFLLPGNWYVIVAALLASGLGLLLEKGGRACQRS
jgi:4-azaleucine resistance transporter AzlC